MEIDDEVLLKSAHTMVFSGFGCEFEVGQPGEDMPRTHGDFVDVVFGGGRG